MTFQIHEYGGLPHQRGGFTDGRVPKDAKYHLPIEEPEDKPRKYGPVSVLVRNGKALNDKGAELLRLYSAKPV